MAFICDSLMWVLVDDRPGNYSQAIGLASALKRPYQIKRINYNFLANLPNFLKFNSLLEVDKVSRAALLNSSNQPPQIIIGAGRKTAPVSVFLKKYYQKVFNIHLMGPELPASGFDLLILPEHDNPTPKSNLITSIGALNRIDSELLLREYQKFSTILDRVQQPTIALLLGGSSKKKRFNADIAASLIKFCFEVAKAQQFTLLIVTSRRTDQPTLQEIKKYLAPPHLLFEWSADRESPYLAVLQAANYIIATGDSMSMCSESCATGKPVYIFNPSQICSPKHLRLHETLFLGGYARQLNINRMELPWFDALKLNETARIAEQVGKTLLAKSL